ncbi:MAG TPA: fructosamine kinase family protein [Nocardioidaceae bacterium]|nr:fructosamine kinase family protein [Nocardioidaceae bacterium]
MARSGTIASRVEDLLGVAVVATAPVAGGDICVATRVRLSDGRGALVKTRAQAPTGFFAAEAAGLRWLAAATPAGGVHVPELLAIADDCLVLGWVEPGRPNADSVEAFARRLAATHQSGAPAFGADHDGFIGLLPLPNSTLDNWAEFWATRRVLPYLRAARDRGAISTPAATAVEQVATLAGDLAGPPEPPQRIHGDLWSGNVVWSNGGVGYVVDPAAHGGHRETDLAMLTLFGAPHLARLLAAYDEAYPLAPGWRERVPLHQLHPLLVHAVLFGGSYGERAGTAARAALAGTGQPA